MAATPTPLNAHTRAAFRFSWVVPDRRFFTADMCPISGNVQRTVANTGKEPRRPTANSSSRI